MQAADKNKSVLFYALMFLPLLLVPLFGNLMSDEVNWTGFDFAFGAVMLLALGAVIGVIQTRMKKSIVKLGLVLVSLAIFVVIWGWLATTG